MKKNSKQLSSAFSTGGGGTNFETRVQSSYALLMLIGGYAPALPCWPIVRLKLQGKVEGYDTDDLIVTNQEPGSQRRQHLLGQVKQAVSINKSDKSLSQVIEAAWATLTPCTVTK